MQRLQMWHASGQGSGRTDLAGRLVVTLGNRLSITYDDGMRGLAISTVLLVGCSIPEGPNARDIDVAFQSAPDAVTREPVAEFVFSAEGELTFTCSLDGATQAACTSPQSFSVFDGEHSFAVRAVDVTHAAGAPTVHAWVVDTVPPDLTVTGPTLTSDTTPEFMISSTTVPVALRCRIDGGAFETCASLFTPTLADGTHTLDFEAEDAATNIGSTSRTIEIDSAAPAIAIVAPLIPARVNNKQPAVSFTLNDATNLVVECAVDAAAFAACTSGFAASTPLADGSHTYHVRATDQALNTATTDVQFIVDTTAPDLTITVTPTTPGTDTTPTFEFTVANQTSVRCELSTGEVVTTCSSPVTFGPLAIGVRTFSVIASDDAVAPNTTTRSFLFEITP